MLAAAHPEIAFVVMLAGTGVTGEQIMLAPGRGHHEGQRRVRGRHRRQHGPPEAGVRDPSRGEDDGAHRRAAAGAPRARVEGRLRGAREAVLVALVQVLRHVRPGARAERRSAARCSRSRGALDLQVLPAQNLPAIERRAQAGRQPEPHRPRTAGPQPPASRRPRPACRRSTRRSKRRCRRRRSTPSPPGSASGPAWRSDAPPRASFVWRDGAYQC